MAYHGITLIRTRLEEQQELQRLNDQLRLYIQRNRVLELNNERLKVKHRSCFLISFFKFDEKI